jgi:hypothetical protein
MKTNLTDEEVESIGIGFVTRYYDALVGVPNPLALQRFYNDKSKYVVAQHGRPNYEMKGLLLIGRFMKRMGYSECTVTIRSVTTAVRPTAELMVSSIGELSQPGNMVPQKFTQSSVIKRVPWTVADYQIVETVFRYDSDTMDHRIPIAVSGTPVVDGPKRNDTSAMASDEKAAGKPKHTPANRVGKSNVSGRKSTTSTVPVASSLTANGIVDGKSSNRRPTYLRKLTPAIVSVTEKPIKKVKPVMKNLSSKGTQSLIIQMYCENRTHVRNV